MWMFYVGLILFYLWPLLLATAFWLAWKLTKKRAFRRLSVMCIALNIVWIFAVSMAR
jgi:hypothetical protein